MIEGDYSSLIMEDELLSVADGAVSQPGILGYICVDREGLCLAAKGQIQQSMSGVIHQIALLANKIEESQRRMDSNSEKTKVPPVVRVDMERYKMIIQSRDSITTALISNQK